MAIDLLIGLQWGDEGKGKMIDILAPNYKAVARFNGGPNAGHTIEFNGKKFVLHVVPSGVHREGCKNFIGNGLVISPTLFVEEIKNLEQSGIDVKKALLISNRAHIIIPTHCMLDKANELAKGDKKIGSTGKGIGPTYKDKAGRDGLRMADIISDSFKEKYEILKKNHLDILQNLYKIENSEISSIEVEEKKFFEAVEYLKSYNICDTTKLINEEIATGNNILAEGAQGVFLDIDHGTYPFVTSSSVTAGGVCTGLGISPKSIGKIYGAFKAYATRVGSGPFPTELSNEIGETMRKIGNEFGATTGRPRRCGWLDLVALKYACVINGVTDLIILKSDVLDSFDEIKVCTKYYDNLTKSEVDWPPLDLANVEPIFETKEGWKVDTSKYKNSEELPKQLKDYLKFVTDFIGIPISYISVGPDREQTILVK